MGSRFDKLNSINHHSLSIDKLKAHYISTHLNQHSTIILVIAHLAALDNIIEEIARCATQPINEVQDAILGNSLVRVIVTRNNNIRAPFGKRPLHSSFRTMFT